MLGHRTLDVKDYLGILKRRLWLIVLCLIVFPVLALSSTFFLQPRYVSQTLVLIQEQKVPDDYVKPVISSNLDSRLASMKEQILSRSRIEPIIVKYNLYPGKRMTMDDRLDLARKAIEIKPIRSEVARAGGLPGFFITFTANDPHTAQLVCGEITSLFLNENLRSREASAEGTTDFLKSQLADAKHNLDEQDSKLADFQRRYVGKLPDEAAPNLNMMTSLNTQLEAATQALARMQQDKTYQESMLSQQAQPVAPASSAAPAAPDTAQQQARNAELLKLQEEETDLLAHYTPDYPDVIAVRRRIAEKQKQIASPQSRPSGTGATGTQTRVADTLAVQQLRAQLRSAEVGIQAKQREQAQLQSSLQLYQERIQSSPLVEEQYKELTRDNQTAQKFYDDLLTKMNHSKMATDLERRQEGEQFTMMDEPNLPDSPVFPKKWVFGLGGLALGLALGLGITAFLEYRDTSLRDERDVYVFTRLPTLATISVLPDGPGAGLRLGGLFGRKRNAEPTQDTSGGARS